MLIPTVARIHYEIPDDLHRRVKAAAAMRGITLKEFTAPSPRRGCHRQAIAEGEEAGYLTFGGGQANPTARSGGG